MIEWDKSSDASLVVAIARWNEAALAEVYRRHGGAVHSLAARLLGSHGSPDEVTQDVFLKLWERPERFDPDKGSLRGFLLSITHGRAVDQVRSLAARRLREEKSASDIAMSGYDIEHHAWDLHLGERVRRAITGLSEGERRAIELAYFGGHSYREVARLLGEPEGTVKARIRSGLARLRRAMEREGVQL
jgi:RNA polymerase sigma-70 factor (ECF subfamily)